MLQVHGSDWTVATLSQLIKIFDSENYLHSQKNYSNTLKNFFQMFVDYFYRKMIATCAVAASVDGKIVKILKKNRRIPVNYHDVYAYMRGGGGDICWSE